MTPCPHHPPALTPRRRPTEASLPLPALTPRPQNCRIPPRPPAPTACHRTPSTAHSKSHLTPWAAVLSPFFSNRRIGGGHPRDRSTSVQTHRPLPGVAALVILLNRWRDPAQIS